MAEWERIELASGGPILRGVDPEFPGQDIFEWELSRQPEREWAEAFQELAFMNSFRVSLAGAAVVLKPARSDREREAYENAVHTWVEQVNTRRESLNPPT